MTTFKAFGLSLIMITLIAAPALAIRDGWGSPVDQEPPRMRHAEHLKLLLELTQDQETTIREIISKNREEAAAQRQNALAKREELQQLLKAETLDETRVRALIREQAEMRADRMVKQYASRAAIDQVLTAEQREKHQALQLSRGKRQGMHHQTRYAQRHGMSY